MSSSASTVIRPVGSGAQFYTSRHALGVYRSVISTTTYLVPPTLLAATGPDDGPLTRAKTTLELALAKVVARHGSLRVAVVGEHTTSPTFVHLPSIRLAELVDWKQATVPADSSSYTDFVLQSITAQHDHLWFRNAHRPLWKITVHVGREDPEQMARHGMQLDISFAFHHIIVDGQSSLIFHRHLLEALNSIDAASLSSPAPPVLHFSDPAVLARPLEDLIPFSFSWPYLLSVLGSAIGSKLVPSAVADLYGWFTGTAVSPSALPWTGSIITQLEPRQANVRLLQVSNPQLVALLAKCRGNGTTLTGLMQVLIMRSLTTRLPRSEAPCLIAQTCISLRPFAVSSPNDPAPFDKQNGLHSLVTVHRHTFDAAVVDKFRQPPTTADDNALLWQTTTDFGQALRAKVQTLPHDDIMGLLGYVSDWKKYWLDKVGKRRDDSWELSNWGVLPASPPQPPETARDRWQITRSIPTQGASPLAVPFAVNMASVQGRGLCITATWQETSVERRLVDGLVEDLETWFDELTGTGI